MMIACIATHRPNLERARAAIAARTMAPAAPPTVSSVNSDDDIDEMFGPRPK